MMHDPAVLGTEFLRAPWLARTKRFWDTQTAEMYLFGYARDHAAMDQIKKVARSLNTAGPAPLSDRDAITILAANLVSGHAWIIEFPAKAPKSRLVTKTSPDAFAPINPKYGTKVDFTFIASLEGDQWLRGYIPMSQGKVIANSGMTVATGFDLGQWRMSDLQDLGFSKQLLDKLRPYLGHPFRGFTKTQVIEKVGKLGPVPQLTKAEADTCDAAVFSKILGDVISVWNAPAALSRSSAVYRTSERMADSVAIS